jgi:tetratricopeptide (TPR) repeat protein
MKAALLMLRAAGAAAVLLALGGCAFGGKPSGPVRDPEIVRIGGLARVLFDKGAYPEAVALFERNLTRARLMDDSGEIGIAAYNLGAALLAAGRLEESSLRLREARTELLRAGQPVTDTWILDARVAREQGQAEEAMNRLDQALASVSETTPRGQRVLVRTLRAELAAELERYDLARVELAEARKAAGRSRNAALHAGIARAEGQLCVAEKRPLEAAQAFDRESECLKSARRYTDLSTALVRAAQACEDAGRPGEAADRYYRAGRSLLAQDNPSGAMKMLEQAAALARSAGDAPAEARANALMDEARARDDKAAVPPK